MTTKGKSTKSITEMINDGFLDEIPVTMDVKKCVDEFLQKHIERLSVFAKSEEYGRKLDHLKMKRFLFTAYHNLVEMDHTISQGNITKPYKKLAGIQRVYDELTAFLKKPLKLTFEKLFLSKQDEYVNVKSAIEELSKVIDYYTGRTQVLFGVIERLKQEIERLKKNDAEREKLENIYKKNNKEYVDKLYEISKLKEHLTKLESCKSKFEGEHLLRFGEVFKEGSASLIEEILNMLNSASFEFDIILWEEAKNSEIIRKFFKEAKIEGSFSSKIYLKYYLKSLSEASSDEVKSLRELLAYLESVSLRNVVVVSGNSDEAAKYRVLIESIDKDYIVLDTTSPDKIIIEHKNRGLDCIVIDYELRQESGLEVIKRFWRDFPGSKGRILVLLMFNSPNYKAIDEAGRSGIRYFFLKSFGDDEFLAKIRAIL